MYVSRHGGTLLYEKNSSLERKIRLQASEHAQDIEKYKAKIDEIKLRERHRELVFYAALSHIHEPLGMRNGWVCGDTWDKEIAAGLDST